MRRTIEKLAQDRHEQEARFERELAGLKALAADLGGLLGRLKDLPATPPKRGLFASRDASAIDLRPLLAEAVERAGGLASAVAALAEAQSGLADARDREWDALGSNHVGMIFKSLEWRVDRLAQAAEDAAALLKTFALLKDQLGRLLAALEEKRLPTPALAGEILAPIRDWGYVRFENRFRGRPEDVRKQQQGYAALFPAGKEVLDLGCGRGEFLEVLRERGLHGHGVDANSEMIAACRDKGLSAEQGDLLEALAARPDDSLGGVFSSQVIEHLEPAALRRLVELAAVKLAPGGVVVLETVNPTSVFALVQIYFLDPTHRQPVHPEALRFLLEAAGLAGVEIRPAGELAAERLEELPAADEASSLLNRNIDRLNALLYGPPNYAAVGRKA